MRNPNTFYSGTQADDEEIAQGKVVSIDDPVNPNTNSIKPSVGKDIRQFSKSEEQDPLVAINLDANQIADAWAREQAENRFQTEQKNAGFIKRLWKGNIMKDFYLTKYEREARSDLSRLDRKDYIATLERFETYALENYDNLIHEQAGENLEEEKDPEVVEAVNAMVKWYASCPLEGDELSNALDERIEKLKADLTMRSNAENVPENNFTLDNYRKIAEAARQRFSHAVGIANIESMEDKEEVMDCILGGVRVYSGRAIEGARTEEHQNNVEKITHRIQSSRIGRFVQPEFIAGAASIASYIARAGTGRIASIAIPVGGSLVAGSLAAVRESHHLKSDLANASRDFALGRGKREETKYDRQISSFLNEMKSAKELTEDLSKEEDLDKLQKLVFNAQARIDYGDNNKIDLISFSKPEDCAKERFALDLAIARATAKLKAAGHDFDFSNKARETLLRSELNILAESTNARDRAFAKFRHRRMAAQGAKTAAISMATMVASQEILAFFNSGQVGLLEQFANDHGIVTTTNDPGAANTLLGGMFNLQQVTQVPGEDTTIFINEQYTPTGDQVSVDGYYNNYTSVYDKGELNLYTSNGQLSFGSAHGASGPGLETINNLSDTISNGKGVFVAGINGQDYLFNIDPRTGCAIDHDGLLAQCIDKQGNVLCDYVRYAVQEKTENGVHHIASVATQPGAGNKLSFFRNVLKTYPGKAQTIFTAREVVGDGISMPFTTRKNLSPNKTPDKAPKKPPEERPDEIPRKTPEETPEEIPEEIPEETPEKTPDEIPEETSLSRTNPNDLTTRRQQSTQLNTSERSPNTKNALPNSQFGPDFAPSSDYIQKWYNSIASIINNNNLLASFFWTNDTGYQAIKQHESFIDAFNNNFDNLCQWIYDEMTPAQRQVLSFNPDDSQSGKYLVPCSPMLREGLKRIIDRQNSPTGYPQPNNNTIDQENISFSSTAANNSPLPNSNIFIEDTTSNISDDISNPTVSQQETPSLSNRPLQSQEQTEQNISAIRINEAKRYFDNLQPKPRLEGIITPNSFGTAIQYDTFMNAWQSNLDNQISNNDQARQAFFLTDEKVNQLSNPTKVYDEAYRALTPQQKEALSSNPQDSLDANKIVPLSQGFRSWIKMMESINQ